MEQQNRRKSPLLILLILLLVLLIAAVVWFGYRYFRPFDPAPYKLDAPTETEPSSEPASEVPSETGPDSETEPEPSTEPPLPENPINFAALQEENPDVCGWITVPNTLVDYPILQSSKADDDYYLKHALDGSWSSHGSIYIQRLNNNQFLDRNTVIYGHNMLDDQMFGSLLDFRDPDFFEENEYFTIYLPHHILTYRIFSAYRYDDRHILNSFDFSDTRVYQAYLEFATNPASMIRNVREVTVTTDDRIVTLSTCIGTDRSYRYLVQGVLIDDQYTS